MTLIQTLKKKLQKKKTLGLWGAIIGAYVLVGLLVFTNALGTGSSFSGGARTALFTPQGGTGTSSRPVAGDILLSFADDSYGPAALIEGSNITIATSTFGQLTISAASSAGDPFAWTVESYGVSTTTTLGFLGGFLSTASSTISSVLHADGTIDFQNLFDIDAQLKSGINRLIFKSSTGGNADAELFAAPTGTNTGSQFTFSDSPNTNNFGGLQLGTDGTVNFISATSSGTGTTLPITFGIDGTEAARFDTNGRLGIGENTPLAPLHITNDQAALTELRLDNSNASGSTALSFYDGSNQRGEVHYDTAAALLNVGTNIATGQLSLSTGSDSEALRIDSSGQVGVGDSTPASLFTVGDGDLFQIDSSGIITAIAGLSGATGTFNFNGATSVEVPSNFAGRSLTKNGTAIDADAELYTESIPFGLHATTTSGISTTTAAFRTYRIQENSTITGFDCGALDAGTSTIKAEFRSTLNGAGTQILYSTGATCGNDQELATTTFSSTTLTADGWLYISVSDAEPTGTRPDRIFGAFKTTNDD